MVENCLIFCLYIKLVWNYSYYRLIVHEILFFILLCFFFFSFSCRKKIRSWSVNKTEIWQNNNLTKKICSFKSWYGLYIFYMNALLLIEFDGWRHCFSSQLENDEKCLLCEIWLVFSDFEKKMSDNMLKTDFLQYYESKLFWFREGSEWQYAKHWFSTKLSIKTL